MKLSVIVPAYRQSKTIVEDLARIEAAVKKSFSDYEIIVVVDGRVDSTGEKVAPLSSPLVHPYVYENNRGKGYALRYGFARSYGEIIAFLDAGMEINPEGINTLWQIMQQQDADVVIGSKRHTASKVDYPPLRRLTSLGYQLLVRLLFGLRVRDTQTGLKLFKRAVLAKVMPRLLVKRYAIDIEILALSNYLGYRRIYEGPVEVTYHFDDLTHASALRPIWRMLLDTLAVFYRLRLKRYYADSSRPEWVYDPDLEMKINLG